MAGNIVNMAYGTHCRGGVRCKKKMWKLKNIPKFPDVQNTKFWYD
jgi:hypothetical protein